MRLSCILCFLAMGLSAYGSDYADFEPRCTREWPIPLFQCPVYLANTGKWKFLEPPPRFTVEHKVNGTFCRKFGYSKGKMLQWKMPYVQTYLAQLYRIATLTPEV
uniref:Putative secreted salivary protein n=1 Tax=Ixodes ricinus TaxID=34613 RepID=A0A090X910_IXORI